MFCYQDSCCSGVVGSELTGEAFKGVCEGLDILFFGYESGHGRRVERMRNMRPEPTLCDVVTATIGAMQLPSPVKRLHATDEDLFAVLEDGRTVKLTDLVTQELRS